MGLWTGRIGVVVSTPVAYPNPHRPHEPVLLWNKLYVEEFMERGPCASVAKIAVLVRLPRPLSSLLCSVCHTAAAAAAHRSDVASVGTASAWMCLSGSDGAG